MIRITYKRVLEAIEEDNNTGFCLACGAEASCVEPDAERYECDECGNHNVMGAELCHSRFTICKEGRAYHEYYEV